MPISLPEVLQSLTAALQNLVTVLGAGLAPAGSSAPIANATAGAAELPTDVSGGGAPAPGGCGCGAAAGAVAGAGANDPTQVAQTGAGKAPKAKKAKKTDAATQQAPPAPGNLVSGPQKHSAKENAQVVAQVAKEKGVDPVMAVAMMLTESGGDNTNKTGDGGTSFGLFQLHQGGMLPADWYPGKPNHDFVFDPRKNAEISLGSLARYAKETGKTGGALAAASQRPADPSGYARTVDGKMDEARKLLGM